MYEFASTTAMSGTTLKLLEEAILQITSYFISHLLFTTFSDPAQSSTLRSLGGITLLWPPLALQAALTWDRVADKIQETHQT
jgi:hypothetical protein